MSDFKFGTVTVPDGKAGPWTIDSFTVARDDVLMHNMRAARDGNGYAMMFPGTYKRLSHKNRGVVMSNTMMEIRTAQEAYYHATGRVFVSGLGLGMVVEGMLAKPQVSHVRVIEIDEDVISLVAPHFEKNPKFELIHGSILDYKPAKDEKYDYAWHDIWDDINTDNLPEMTKVCRKFQGKALKQGCWSREQARLARDRERREEKNRWW